MKKIIYHPQFESSEYLEQEVAHHIFSQFDRFPRYRVRQVRVHLEIVNSALQPGKDVYLCSVFFHEKSLGDVFIRSPNPASTVGALCETMN